MKKKKITGARIAPVKKKEEVGEDGDGLESMIQQWAMHAYSAFPHFGIRMCV